MTESKVPGFEPGEFVRDPADERLTAALPRTTGTDDETYVRLLEARGLAVVLPRADLARGGYPKAKAKAVTQGVPLLVPYEPGDRPPQHAFGDANGGGEPFDYLKWRAEYERGQREGLSRYERYQP